MKTCKPACLVFILISITAYSYSQSWKQFTDSAKILQGQRKMEQAMEFYSMAREALKRDSIGSNTYAASCINLGSLFQNMGKYERAEELYLEAKEVREKKLGKQHLDYAVSCSNLGMLYFAMGRFAKAEPLLQEVKEIRQNSLGKENAAYAGACNNLAALYRNMGLYDKAEPLLLEAKQIREKVLGKQHTDYANSCNNLANLYKNLGQYGKAELLHLEAKQIRETLLGKEHPDYAQSCNNLAGLYLDMGQFEKAEALYLEAKQIREKVTGTEHIDYAFTCNTLGILYNMTKRYDKAEPLYLQALQIRERILGKEHPDYANSCNNLAILYFQTDKFEKAEPLYLEAKNIWEKLLGKNSRFYALSCLNMGTLYSNMGEYDKAEPLYLEARNVLEKVVGREHIEFGEVCEGLANFYWLRHQLALAEKQFRSAFSVKVANLSSFFQFANEKEKTAYVRGKIGEDAKAYSFYVSEKIRSEQPYSMSLFYRNLVLSTSQALNKHLASSNDTALVNKYRQWISLKKYRAVLYTRPVEERKEDAMLVEANAAKLEKELTRVSPTFAKQQQKTGWKDIQRKLRAGEAAIEFTSFHFFDVQRYTDTVLYIASVIRKDKAMPALVVLFNESQLTTLLSATGNGASNDGVEKLYASRGVTVTGKVVVNRSIYNLVWKPMEKELNGIKTIYFAPAGILHRIAFAALPVNKTEVLSDRYNLVQLATTASVADLQHRSISPSDNIALYGGMSYHADTTALKNEAMRYHTGEVHSRSVRDDLTRNDLWNDLPGTQNEINEIALLSGNYKKSITSFSGIHATEESFKALDGKASPAVVHIAGHGFFYPDPKNDQKNEQGQKNSNVFKSTDDPLMRSGLLFTGANNAWQNKPAEGIDDGILTAYEVANLYLPNTKLVVLSACETGLGDIQGSEGVYGLQRAFKIAGAQSLVMSLWKVPDQETAEFMKYFYKNLFAGKVISDAFYQAQKIMRNKYRQHPYKWAAWVLVR